MANDAVRRIMAEVREFSNLNQKPGSFFCAEPLESDLFEWHFTVRGPPDTAFEYGVYHGRIVLPAEYPLKAPEIILLTPNGRFEVGKRICLSVTSHHQESWQPSWGIRTILTALVGFMPSKAEGVGALDYPNEDRKMLARKSHAFICDRCGARPAIQLPPRQPTSEDSNNTQSNENDQKVGEQKNVDEIVASEIVGSSEQHAQMRRSSSANEQGEKVKTDDRSKEDNVEVKKNVDVKTTVENEDVRNIEVVSSSVSQRNRSGNQERELLFVAYAIIGLMFAVIARRVFKMMMGSE